jgi:U4/U6 small nuclear ribonucleoprotein PRP3
MQKRAEIAAKLAVFKKDTLGWTPPVRAPVPAKPAATSSSATVSSGPTPATGSPALGSPAAIDDIARRVSEAKRRVAEAQNKLATKDNPYMVGYIDYSVFTSAKWSTDRPSEREEGSSR